LPLQTLLRGGDGEEEDGGGRAAGHRARDDEDADFGADTRRGGGGGDGGDYGDFGAAGGAGGGTRWEAAGREVPGPPSRYTATDLAV